VITNELDQVFTASHGAVRGQLVSRLSDIAPVFNMSTAGTATGQIRISGVEGGIVGVAIETHQNSETSQSAGLNLDVQGTRSSADMVVLPGQ
jgi:hypothetical protein